MNLALRSRVLVPSRLVRRHATLRTHHFRRQRILPTSLRICAISSRQAAFDAGCRLGRIESMKRHLHGTVTQLKDYPPHTVFPMPALSPTMEMGSIAKWNLKEGDEFAAGDILCSVETDKATIDFESQDDGILAKILREPPNASDIPIGTPICVVVEDESDVAAFADFSVAETAPAAVAESEKPPEALSTSSHSSQEGPPESNQHPLLPAARFLSESRGLDATGLVGTGKGGRVTKGDVLQALANGTVLPPLEAPAPAPPVAPTTEGVAAASAATTPIEMTPLEVDTAGGYEDVPNNNMRKVIARRLTESKSGVPHFYTSLEVELDNVLKLRKQLVSNHDVKVSVNDVIIRCCALALRDVPEVNGTYNPKTDTVKLRDSIDISVAVATPTGLITPIVPNTDELGLSAITDKVRDLAGRARDGKLAPEEYQGGTFCVSNLGMFGIDEFSAVINPPQAAIMAVGGGTRRVVPTPYVEGAEEQAQPEIKTIMTARLSADRRVVDEATAALFLSVFEQYINKPELTLL